MDQNVALALSILAVQAIFVPFLVLSLCLDFGPRWLKTGMLASIFVGAVMGAVLSVKLGLPYNAATWVFYGGFASFLVALWFEISMRRDVLNQLKLAPQVACIGVDEFKRIDVRSRGEIRVEDILTAIEKGRVNKQALSFLHHMAEHIASIGHVVEVIPPSYPGVVPVMIHAINLEDLFSYDARIRQRLAAWT